jgi:hypothetical protein
MSQIVRKAACTELAPAHTGEAHVFAEPGSRVYGVGQAEHTMQITNHTMDASANPSSTWCSQPNTSFISLSLYNSLKVAEKTNNIQFCVQIYTIRNKLFMTFMSFEIIVYSAILCINLLC